MFIQLHVRGAHRRDDTIPTLSMGRAYSRIQDEIAVATATIEWNQQVQRDIARLTGTLDSVASWHRLVDTLGDFSDAMDWRLDIE